MAGYRGPAHEQILRHTLDVTAIIAGISGRCKLLQRSVLQMNDAEDRGGGLGPSP
jgi:hypothetical protein